MDVREIVNPEIGDTLGRYLGPGTYPPFVLKRIVSPTQILVEHAPDLYRLKVWPPRPAPPEDMFESEPGVDTLTVTTTWRNLGTQTLDGGYYASIRIFDEAEEVNGKPERRSAPGQH
jgi:hypothetical protein